jgi:hypothetical protein
MSMRPVPTTHPKFRLKLLWMISHEHLYPFQVQLECWNGKRDLKESEGIHIHIPSFNTRHWLKQTAQQASNFSACKSSLLNFLSSWHGVYSGPRELGHKHGKHIEPHLSKRRYPLFWQMCDEKSSVPFLKTQPLRWGSHTEKTCSKGFCWTQFCHASCGTIRPPSSHGCQFLACVKCISL